MGRDNNIFAELYNKVLSFFVAPQAEDPTKDKAMSRLKVVLMQDRAGFSERALQMMKAEMVNCISRYMEIEEDRFELQLDAQDENTVLMLTIPVIRPKTDEEIDQAIKEQEEKTQVKAEEIVQELEGIIEERAQALADELLENKQGDDQNVEDEEETQADIRDENEAVIEESEEGSVDEMGELDEAQTQIQLDIETEEGVTSGASSPKRKKK